jgi:hypothetical protein
LIKNQVTASIPSNVFSGGKIPSNTYQEGVAYFRDSSLDFMFDSFSSTSTAAGADSSTMFYASSTAQSTYIRVKGGWYFSDGGYGHSSQEHNAVYKWWTMHMAVYGIAAGNFISEWALYDIGSYKNAYIEGDSGFYGVGSSGSTSWSSGTLPYSQKTINTGPITAILADSTVYD